MATKVWNGATASFTIDADWSCGLRPVAGDIASITAGTLSLDAAVPTPLTFQVSSSASSSPTLVVQGVDIPGGTTINEVSSGSDATLSIVGQVTNKGRIAFSGDTQVITVGGSATASVLTNQSSILLNGQRAILRNSGNASLVNNGIIAFDAATASPELATVAFGVGGAGSILLNGPVTLQFNSSVSSTQTVVFEQGAANLQVNLFAGFQGIVSGFGSDDRITAVGRRWDGVDFTRNSTGGVLTFKSQGTAVGAVTFNGAYTSLDNFKVFQDSQSGLASLTDITTSTAPPPARLLFTDTATGVSGTDPGTAYTGPVSYLQYQYLWSGTDGVAISANTGNVFLHGGAGDDALSASSGSNVLDGGGGSNFLVGASGTDGGADTFFVDERGGSVTWSTLLNFHQGDALTIFGFTAGTSTPPFTDGEGATGYTGATIHSEINGASTGVNGSVTFVGYSVADVQSKFSVTTGSVGGTNYLYVLNHG